MRERRHWRAGAWAGLPIVAAVSLLGLTLPSRAAPGGGPESLAKGDGATEQPSSASRPAALAASYLAVPLDSPLYDDLEHFRALGLWPGSLELRPIRRQVFAEAAAAIRAAARTHRLAPRDEFRLQRFEGEVSRWRRGRPAIETAASAGAGSRDEPPIRAELAAALRFAGAGSDLDSLADLDRRSRREQFLILSADAAVGATAFLQWRFYEDYDRLTPFHRGDRWADNLPPDAGSVLNSPSARNDQAVIGAGWKWGEVRLGREDRRWGTGRRGTLFLGENPFPLDGLSARFNTRYLAGASLLAQRRRGNDRVPVGGGKAASPATVTTGDAWLAAHRIELRPPGPARLGFFEAVAWSGRGIDLGYANPAALLVAVTQDLFDRAAATGANIDDKKVVGFDLALDVRPVSVYGELLINRVVTLDADQGPDGDATTWAQLLGLRLCNPPGLAGADLDLEYAHLDPEVYFHKDGDPGLALLSEGEPLGHWVGPNADSFYAGLSLPLGARLGTAALSFERCRWGVIEGRRGTELGFFSLRKRDKRWITGRIEAENLLSVEWRQASFRLSPGLELQPESRLARVDRSGMRTPDGWQAEFRLTCRASTTLGE